MSRMRTTVKISELVAQANRHLAFARSAGDRRGIAQLLEAVLYANNAYAGFGYLPSELVMAAYGRSHLMADHDDTRRFYYDPVTGHRAGHDATTLYEAVRGVVQDLRQAGPDLSPADAVKHARTAFDKYTIPDEATWTGRAYRLVIEASDSDIDRVLRARYGQRYDRADVPS